MSRRDHVGSNKALENQPQKCGRPHLKNIHEVNPSLRISETDSVDIDNNSHLCGLCNFADPFHTQTATLHTKKS